MIDLTTLSVPELKMRLTEAKTRAKRFETIQMVRKVGLNSAYGAVGADAFRYFDVRQAEAVTLSGQMVIRRVEQELNAYLNKVLKTDNQDYCIASDTDSVYLNLEKVAAVATKNGAAKDKILDALNYFCKTKLEPVIEKIFVDIQSTFAQPKNILRMKREALADKGVWQAKKYYILNVLDSEGVRLSEPKMKMKGIAAVRSNTPVACRDHLKKCLEILLRGTQEELWAYVDKVRQTFYTLPFEDVATPMGVNGIAEYERPNGTWESGTPIHVKAAITYNHMLREHGLEKKYEPIQDHDKIKFAYLKQPNIVGQPVIAAPDGLPIEWLDKIQPKIDYDRQLQRSFLGPLEDIVTVAGWTIEEKGSLEDLFS